MEDESRLSSPQPGLTQESASSPATDRRKSGRVTRKPELLSQTYSDATGAKRKRGTTGEDGEGAGEEDDESEPEDASESGSEDEEPDEEESRENKRAARKKPIKKTPKSNAKSRTTPAAKKPKVAGNGIGGQLALRPATNGRYTKKRPRKPKVRPSLAAGEHGLYGR